MGGITEKFIVTAVAVKTTSVATSKIKGVAIPGYIESRGGVIEDIVLSENITFYRVYSGNSKTGGWLTKVPPKSRKLAQEGLALPKKNKATRIQKVDVPAGTRLQRSRAKPMPEFGKKHGGMEQFELKGDIPNSAFGKGEKFK